VTIPELARMLVAGFRDSSSVPFVFQFSTDLPGFLSTSFTSNVIPVETAISTSIQTLHTI
jgi:hypothetical protein